MNILQIGKTYPMIGGVDKVIFELSKGLSQKTFRCDVLCASTDNHFREIELNQFSKIYAAPSVGKIASTWISPALIVKLCKIIKQYDIIHIHHPDPMAAIALFFAKTKGKKIVLHWHSDIVKQKTLLKFYTPLQNWLINRCDKIIATSEIYAQGSKHINKYLDKTIIIPIGVVVEYNPNQESYDKIVAQYPRKKIIYSLGRLCYYKGYEYLIKAANYLNDDFVILIGGTGSLEKKLRNLINSDKVGNKVKLLGKIEDDEMAAYFSASTLFCLPSIEKSEAFGIVQIEAMAYGKPVIATNIPFSGVSWVNKHGFSGLNVKPGNPEELANAIMTICNNPETLRQFSLNAKQRYKDEFTREMMINRVLDVYKLLLNVTISNR